MLLCERNLGICSKGGGFMDIVGGNSVGEGNSFFYCVGGKPPIQVLGKEAAHTETRHGGEL